MLPLAGFNLVVFHGTMFGAFNAMNLQTMAAVILIVTQWIVTFPVALYVAYNTPYGVKGLFLVQGLGLTLQTISCLVVIGSSDWNDIAAKTQERMVKENTLNDYQSLPQEDDQNVDA